MLMVDVATWEMLRVQARGAAEHAYAPYSRLRVGAAVLTAGGGVFTGCNVENASFGLTICAERAAVCAMVASGSTHLLALVVTTAAGRVVAPCGACRQVLAEFADPDVSILLCADGVADVRVRLRELLPMAFARGDVPSDDPR
ncbi:MAG: cytidine deaminase [Firmicutes bacterium]|nr:cytidine deaminase [Bacillota bacterium]